MIKNKQSLRPNAANDSLSKHEYKNPMHRAAAKYKNENQQLKDLYKMNKAKKKDVLYLAKI